MEFDSFGCEFSENICVPRKEWVGGVIATSSQVGPLKTVLHHLLVDRVIRVGEVGSHQGIKS
jgi:hypothetical protein